MKVGFGLVFGHRPAVREKKKWRGKKERRMGGSSLFE